MNKESLTYSTAISNQTIADRNQTEISEYLSKLEIPSLLLILCLSFLIFGAAFYIILKQAINILRLRSLSKDYYSIMSQGLTFKAVFFIALFLTCLCKLSV